MAGIVEFESDVSNPVSALFLYVGNLQSVSVKVEVRFGYVGRYFYSFGYADAILFSECSVSIRLEQSMTEILFGSTYVFPGQLASAALLSYSSASLKVFDCAFEFAVCAGKAAGFLMDVRKEVYFGSTEASLELIGAGVVSGMVLTSRCQKITLVDSRLVGNLTCLNADTAETASALIADPVVVPVTLHGAGYCFRGKIHDPTKLSHQWNGIIRNCVKAEFQQCIVMGATQTIGAERVRNGVVFQTGSSTEMDITLNFDRSFIQANWTLYNLQTTFRHIKLSGIVNLADDVNATLFTKSSGQVYHCIQIRIPQIHSLLNFYFIQQTVRSINITHLFIDSVVLPTSTGLVGIYNHILPSSVVHVESVRIEGKFETSDKKPKNCLLFNTSSDAKSIYFKRVSIWPVVLDMGTGVSFFLNSHYNTLTNEQYSGHLWVTDCMTGLGAPGVLYSLNVENNFGGIVGTIENTWLIFTRIDVQLYATFQGSAAANLGMAVASVLESNVTVNNVTVFSEIQLQGISDNFGFLGLVTKGYHYLSGLKIELQLKGTITHAGFYGSLLQPVNATFVNVSSRNSSWAPSGGFLFSVLESTTLIYLDVLNASCTNTSGSIPNLMFYKATYVRLYAENLTLHNADTRGGLCGELRNSRIQLNEIRIQNNSVVQGSLVGILDTSSINFANLTYRGSSQSGAVHQMTQSVVNMTNVTVEEMSSSAGNLGVAAGSSGTFMASNFSSSVAAQISAFCTGFNGWRNASVECNDCAGKGCV